MPRIKFTAQVPDIDAAVKSAVDSQVRERLDRAYESFSEAVDASVEAGRTMLSTNTPVGQFPSAANPPARRKTGEFMSKFRRRNVGDKNSEQFVSTVGWHGADGFEVYYAAQEKGFDHATAHRFITGVNALTRTREAFVDEMRKRGF